MAELIIGIFHLLYRIFLRPLDNYGVLSYILSACVIILAIIMANCIVKIIIRMILKKEKRAGVIFLFGLLCLYLIVSIWKLTYYFDGGKKTVTPELVAVIPAEEQQYGIIQAYYTIDRPPFKMETIYQPIHSFSQDVSDELLLSYIDDDYTYIVSYGRSIDNYSYTCWYGYDELPAPWNGTVYYSTDYKFGLERQPTVYIYRVPKTALEPR